MGSSTGDDPEDDVQCSDNGCFATCVRRVLVPGSAGELCTEPAEQHPSWSCELVASCPVLVVGLDVEPDLDAAECVLTALRDGTPGALRVESSRVDIDVYVLTDGTVLVDAEGPVAGTCLGRQIYSSLGGLELRAGDDPYWQTCLDAETGQDLETCFFEPIEDITEFDDTPSPWQAEICTPAAVECEG